MPEHFHRDVPGWFDDDFRDAYAGAVAAARPGATFVEVGAWLGKSTAFMCVELMERGRHDVTFFAVDTFAGSPDEDHHRTVVRDAGGSVYPRFLANLARGGVLGRVVPLVLESVKAAELFPDGSVDFCFIDACHAYDAVAGDIRAWLRTIRPGGTLAGHDYGPSHPGVARAVDELLPGRVVRGNVWAWGA